MGRASNWLIFPLFQCYVYRLFFLLLHFISFVSIQSFFFHAVFFVWFFFELFFSSSICARGVYSCLRMCACVFRLHFLSKSKKKKRTTQHNAFAMLRLNSEFCGKNNSLTEFSLPAANANLFYPNYHTISRLLGFFLCVSYLYVPFTIRGSIISFGMHRFRASLT